MRSAGLAAPITLVRRPFLSAGGPHRHSRPPSSPLCSVVALSGDVPFPHHAPPSPAAVVGRASLHVVLMGAPLGSPVTFLWMQRHQLAS